MKDNKEPILILIGLFVLLGLAYSPLKHANLNRQNDAEIVTGGETDINIMYSPNQNVAGAIKSAEKDVQDLEKNIEEVIEESTRSPYYDKIRMSNITGLRQNDPNKEYIYISTNLNKDEAIKITGWYLKSEITGYYVIIGKAALLPFPSTKVSDDIILRQRDRVYLTKGFSPINVSFRTNKCTGYFEENRTFTPALSLQCPLPKDEELPQFSTDYDRNDECIDIIERIPRCITLGSEFIRDLPDTVTQSCKNYITTQINYDYCVVKHFGDTDFPGNEYRVYLNKFGPLWRTSHDIINLHDETGLIVDTISY